jgi:hypothetical protein
MLKNSSANHSFSVNLAMEFGVMEAIVIHHFEMWIDYNKRLKRNFINGLTWTYQTIEEIAASLPYFSTDQIFRCLKKLVDKNILVKGNFNRTQYDRTMWYAFKNEKEISISQICGMGAAKSQNGNREIAKPIPCIKNISTETTTATEKFAAVFSCLREIDIPESDKEWLSSKHSEADVQHAVMWATHHETKITTSLQQALKWAAKTKPPIPIDLKNMGEENKLLAKSVEARVDKDLANVIAGPNGAEIFYIVGSTTPVVVPYENKNFKEIFKKALYDFKIKLRPKPG